MIRNIKFDARALILPTIGLAILLGQAVFAFTIAEDPNKDPCVALHPPIEATSPDRAAALAEDLADRPDEALCTLSAHNMRPADYRALMEEIAADDALASEYIASRKSFR